MNIHETAFALHFYNQGNSASILSIPKQDPEFIQLFINHLEVDEKLGSYEMLSSTLHKSKDLKYSHWEKSNDRILIYFSFSFKTETYDLILNVSFQEVHGLNLKIVSALPEDINSIQFNIPNNSSAVFGGGVQFSHWNLRGHKFPLIVEENGVGRGDKGSTFLASLFGASGHSFASYAPLPKFYTSNQLAYYLYSADNDIVWDVDFTKRDLISFQANKISGEWLSYPSITIQQKSPLEFAKNDLKKEDRAAMILKDWMQGYILGVQGGKSKVDSIINRLQAHDIQLSAVWIQDWVGKRPTPIGSRLEWDWKPNYLSYPNLENWIDSLNESGIRVLGYINPYFVEEGEQAKIGVDSSYFVKRDNELPYKFKAGGFKAYMLDLSNKKTLEWTKMIIQDNLLNTGFNGWMCDFGEWLPFHDIHLANQTLDKLHHNDFPEQWLKTNIEALDEYCAETGCSSADYFIFNRSWHTEENTIPRVMWAGDQMGDFGQNDGLGSAVTAYVTSGISGIPYMHSDIGGYTAIKLGPLKFLRDDEALKRWIEMETFTPVWRSHEGLIPAHMSQIYQNDEMLEFFAKFDSIHQYLIPTYFNLAQQEFVNYGYPIVRPLYLNYPEDKNAIDIQYQFMVGSKLLVCPVLESSCDELQVYLPAGEWTHLLTGKNYLGGQFYQISSPLGTPAVFVNRR